MGAWVGFNDRRIAFRSMQWGQGGAGALSLVGRFMQRLQRSDLALPDSERFDAPPGYEEMPLFRDESYQEPDTAGWHLPNNFFEANERSPEWEKYDQRQSDARPSDVVPFQTAPEKAGTGPVDASEMRPPQRLRMSRPAPPEPSTPPPAPPSYTPPPANRTPTPPRPSGSSGLPACAPRPAGTVRLRSSPRRSNRSAAARPRAPPSRPCRTTRRGPARPTTTAGSAGCAVR